MTVTALDALSPESLVQLWLHPQATPTKDTIRQLAQADFRQRIRSLLPRSALKTLAYRRWRGRILDSLNRGRIPGRYVNLDSIDLARRAIRPQHSVGQYAARHYPIGEAVGANGGNPPLWHYVDFVTAVFTLPLPLFSDQLVWQPSLVAHRLDVLGQEYLAATHRGRPGQGQVAHEEQAYLLALYEATVWHMAHLNGQGQSSIDWSRYLHYDKPTTPLDARATLLMFLAGHCSRRLQA